MSENTPKTLLELPPAVSFLQAALQRSIDLVAYGLQAAETSAVTELSIPGNFLQLSPAQNLALEPKTARQEFRSWVLANGFRDMVDSLGQSLEYVRQICFFWSRPGKVALTNDDRLLFEPKFTPEEWHTKIVQKTSLFDRLTLLGKFKHLENTYRLDLPASKDAILSLIAARNCLTHRRGIVGLADLRNPSEKGLTIQILKIEFMACGPMGDRKVENQPIVLNAGETFAYRVAASERHFPLGERITFSSAEYIDACSTFLLFALDLDKVVHGFQDRKRAELQ